jgi:hypothetical protein
LDAAIGGDYDLVIPLLFIVVAFGDASPEASSFL